MDDTKKLLGAIQAVAAKHMLAAQAVECSELFKDEVKESISGHLAAKG